MAEARVTFEDINHDPAAPGQEAYFSFRCPRFDRLCGAIPIAGRVPDKRDGQNQNGGIAQWDWDGNRDAPTLAPSINCGKCWHGYIVAGRTRDCAGNDEPEIARSRT
jgi:hypothetical protein